MLLMLERAQAHEISRRNFLAVVRKITLYQNKKIQFICYKLLAKWVKHKLSNDLTLVTKILRKRFLACFLFDQWMGHCRYWEIGMSS